MRPFAMLFVSELWAASSAGVEEHAASVTQLIFPLINFLIVLYLVKRFVLPLVKSHLRSRREELVAALGEADESKRSAEAMARDYRARLARLEEETRKIQEELRAEGQQERTRLLREAAEIASTIKTDADFLVEQEIKLARQKLRGEFARLAQAAAQRLVQDNLTAGDQKQLVEDFLGGVAQR